MTLFQRKKRNNLINQIVVPFEWVVALFHSQHHKYTLQYQSSQYISKNVDTSRQTETLDRTLGRVLQFPMGSPNIASLMFYIFRNEILRFYCQHESYLASHL